MFILIVLLMSISLIGIIAVQLYWINNAVESKKAQFKNDVQKSLGAATEKVNERERAEFEKKLKSFVDVKGFADKAELKSFLIEQIDTVTKEKITLGSTFLEENFKLPTDFLDKEERIKRVLDRDKTNKKEVLSRINSQWKEDKKLLSSNYIIVNYAIQDTKKLVLKIHNILTEKALTIL